jgi:8-oxo-dGTP pyrophosphatase MutT (NUDIX family)
MDYATIDNRLVLSGTFIIDEKNKLLVLYRKDHQHYETAGGKVESSECKNPKNPTLEELSKAALRETKEELGNDIELSKLYSVGYVDVTTADGKQVRIYKFATTILRGTPIVNEPEKFLRIEYLPIKGLEKYPLAPSLKAFLPILKELQI